jgi:hypothetical protein
VIGPPTPFLGSAAGIPTAGVQVGDLPDLWSLTVTQAMVKLGRLESEGKVRRLGDLVLPA